MPVIRFGGNGLSKNTTSQQVSAPTTKDNDSVILDNTLQLDQKVRDLQGISQNIVLDASQIAYNAKNFVLTNKSYSVENFIFSPNSVAIIQGSNYPVISPKTDHILIKSDLSQVVIFENIEFYSGNATEIITIYSDSKVMFKNCVFRKDNNKQSAGNSFITIASPAKVSFVGCWFCGTQTLGNVINNAGVANDVSINGGFNTTGRTHLNTTIFGEQT